jgi:hypothetical protein
MASASAETGARSSKRGVVNVVGGSITSILSRAQIHWPDVQKSAAIMPQSDEIGKRLQPPNGLAFRCHERAGRSFQKRAISREAVCCNAISALRSPMFQLLSACADHPACAHVSTPGVSVSRLITKGGSRSVAVDAPAYQGHSPAVDETDGSCARRPSTVERAEQRSAANSSAAGCYQ